MFVPDLTSDLVKSHTDTGVDPGVRVRHTRAGSRCEELPVTSGWEDFPPREVTWIATTLGMCCNRRRTSLTFIDNSCVKHLPLSQEGTQHLKPAPNAGVGWCVCPLPRVPHNLRPALNGGTKKLFFSGFTSLMWKVGQTQAARMF